MLKKNCVSVVLVVVVVVVVAAVVMKSTPVYVNGFKQQLDNNNIQQHRHEQQQYKQKRRVRRNNQQDEKQQRRQQQQGTIEAIAGSISRSDTMKTITSSGISSGTTINNNNNINNNNDASQDGANVIMEMKEKLQPRTLMTTYNSVTSHTVVQQHQFLHLHHMKTAGTSIDQLIDCGRKRLEVDFNYTIHYANIHECDPDNYDACVNRGFYEYIPDEDNEVGVQCRKKVSHASVMSYCAPLTDLSTPFQWTDYNTVGSVTVLRHPVARVWSMYRFKTKECYDCKSLKQIYEEMDNPPVAVVPASEQNDPDSDDDYTTIDIVDPLCYGQLTNHMIRNIILSDLDKLLASNKSEKEIINEAVSNMKSFFTMIGITEQLSTTVQILGHVFPWLNTTLDGSTKQCTLQHANASPENNKCGPNDTHMPLPEYPDSETTKLIIQHNQLDIELYEAAVQQFELQKLALNL